MHGSGLRGPHLSPVPVTTGLLSSTELAQGQEAQNGDGPCLSCVLLGGGSSLTSTWDGVWKIFPGF